DFVQGIQTFFSHWASLSIPSKKSTPHIIPYCRFTKLIIYYLGSIHNIHRRLESSINVTGDYFLLDNLKFISKGEKDEVFGMPIPKELITEVIQQSPYYQQYLEMYVYKLTAKESVKKKTFHQLINEEKQVHPKPEPQVEDEEYDLQRAQITRQLLMVEGKGKGIATDEQAALSLLDLHKPKKKIRDTSSPTDAKIGADTDKTNNEGDTEILNARSDLGKTLESRPPPEHVLMEKDQAGPNPGQSSVALAGPNPEPIDDDFIGTVYPKVHKSLKHTTKRHVHLENPLSSSGT
nr:histone deacetylase 14 [Tanacetum cinerariifolium]